MTEFSLLESLSKGTFFWSTEENEFLTRKLSDVKRCTVPRKAVSCFSTKMKEERNGRLNNNSCSNSCLLDHSSCGI